ncbi:hypothetical protein RISK_001533 [Rhodopirellula islandica]|uniref:Uncharacterized protein n=1 Tax=Rhodopirellula islandica TaxID=595434 RepID=A0A0J1BIF3_RHOIS|nr:hypothetical protein RISK_001533 [Rhodopirellula islandica]
MPPDLGLKPEAFGFHRSAVLPGSASTSRKTSGKQFRPLGSDETGKVAGTLRSGWHLA